MESKQIHIRYNIVYCMKICSNTLKLLNYIMAAQGSSRKRSRENDENNGSPSKKLSVSSASLHTIIGPQDPREISFWSFINAHGYAEVIWYIPSIRKLTYTYSSRQKVIST